jgi:mannose-1-phosphate guanylyltransferase
MKIRPVILCGGAGTRIWPSSKKNLPKQFINWGGWTLFGETLKRIKSPIFDYPIITTNLSYLKLIKNELKKNKIKKYKILLEPLKKNTAAAILCSSLIKEIPNNQPLVFFSSDNLIGKVKIFNKEIYSHSKHLTDNNIFIFGIKPLSPSSEYGYFLSKRNSNNINKVIKFIEKPNKKRVKKIIKQKAYMNAGMFFAKKNSLITNFKKYQSSMYKNCLISVNKSRLDKNIYYFNKTFFKKIKEISFDYAILEHSKDINAIKLNIPLIDLGNWKEIWKFFKTRNSKKFIKRNTFLRPWGKYINLFNGKGFLLKELIINPKSAISLQKHFHRSERWFINEGKPKITINKKVFFKKINDSILIPKGTIHRIENIYNKPVQIIEVQIGTILKESDIVRYQDIYGRIK